jgi:aminoglycoside/choline kinase family phosphotransferase
VSELVDAYLAERFPGSKATPLAGDASTRSYFRVTEPAGIVALYPEPFAPDRSTFLEVHGLLAGYGLPVPRVLDVDGPRGIVLLQDLGDETLQEALRGGAPPAPLYAQAIDQLGRLQEASSGVREASCFAAAFDVEKLTWELDYFAKYFLEGFRGCRMTPAERASLRQSFRALSEEIASWPRVLCHRDFHSRNLMRHGGELYWLDFQDARLGPAVYDLVSLLRDSYVELPEEFLEEMAGRFREIAPVREDREVFRRRFDRAALQRNLKALGTFGFMTTERGRDVYLPYIPGTLASVRKSLSRVGEARELQRVLAHHIEELQ